MKNLKKFLEKYSACSDGYEFAKDLTLEQFLNTCNRGDWILWLFARTNKNDLAKLTEAKALCANTVRHLMKDERSSKAIDVALAFSRGEMTREELDAAAAAAAYAAYAAYAAAYAAYAAANATYAAAAAAAAYAAYAAADAAYAAADAAYAADAADAAKKANQKLTADICRRTLPLELWDQSEF